MRIDKFLKVSRILKRRSVANMACDNDKVTVNGRMVKPSYSLKIGEEVCVDFGQNKRTFRVVSLNEKATKQEAGLLYEIL